MLGLFKKQKDQNRAQGPVCVVIPAAGSSSRMGGENKLLLPLADTPVLVHTVAAFDRCPLVDQIVLTCREQDIVPYGKLLRQYGFSKVSSLVRGGKTRAESVLQGVLACPESASLVAVHDGARPLVTEEVIREVIETAWETGAAAPVVALKDSVKRVENGRILGDVPRAAIAAVQTPQAFRYQILRRALEDAVRSGKAPTDDCAAVEALGVDVRATTGSYENLKITTPEDLAFGEAILQGRETR